MGDPHLASPRSIQAVFMAVSQAWTVVAVVEHLRLLTLPSVT